MTQQMTAYNVVASFVDRHRAAADFEVKLLGAAGCCHAVRGARLRAAAGSVFGGSCFGCGLPPGQSWGSPHVLLLVAA